MILKIKVAQWVEDYASFVAFNTLHNMRVVTDDHIDTMIYQRSGKSLLIRGRIGDVFLPSASLQSRSMSCAFRAATSSKIRGSSRGDAYRSIQRYAYRIPQYPNPTGVGAQDVWLLLSIFDNTDESHSADSIAEIVDSRPTVPKSSV